MIFRDRVHAGQLLAAELSRYANRVGLLIFALPRGGVIVAFQVAEALNAPLNVLLVRKLGVPGQEELAMGAIASGNIRVLREDLIEALDIPNELVEAVTARERRELEIRERLYGVQQHISDARGREVIIVDDGIATGATMWAAAAAVRRQGPKRLIVGVPVAPQSTCMASVSEADEVVCVLRPEAFFAIGQYYEDFREVSDDEVRDALERAAMRIAEGRRSSATA